MCIIIQVVLRCVSCDEVYSSRVQFSAVLCVVCSQMTPGNAMHCNAIESDQWLGLQWSRYFSWVYNTVRYGVVWYGIDIEMS